jgi:hypothetical protein
VTHLCIERATTTESRSMKRVMSRSNSRCHRGLRRDVWQPRPSLPPSGCLSSRRRGDLTPHRSSRRRHWPLPSCHPARRSAGLSGVRSCARRWDAPPRVQKCSSATSSSPGSRSTSSHRRCRPRRSPPLPTPLPSCVGVPHGAGSMRRSSRSIRMPPSLSRHSLTSQVPPVTKTTATYAMPGASGRPRHCSARPGFAAQPCPRQRLRRPRSRGRLKLGEYRHFQRRAGPRPLGRCRPPRELTRSRLRSSRWRVGRAR